jgi:hypothetical protein
VKTATAFAGFGEPTELEPVLLWENTQSGWRALTHLGEVLEVKAEHPINAGDRITFEAGVRTMPEPTPGALDRYLFHYDHAIALYKANDPEYARVELEAARSIADSVLARWNYGLVLLALGEWKEGLEHYETRHELIATVSGAPRWNGEDLTDKVVLLEHELGFGDTIMMLRYVPMLQQRCGVFLNVPPVLERLAAQLAPVTRYDHGVDYCLPMMSLLHRLEQHPHNVPQAPYLEVERELVKRWQTRLPMTDKPRIGVAWSVGNIVPNDYPRAIPLEFLVDRLRQIRGDAELYSLQIQGGEEAQRAGVRALPIEDFADCAALASLMDEIYSIDTAALHVAGAIGHRNVTALISYWHSWRWRAQWYPRMRIITQDRPDFWLGALVKIS